MKRGTGAASVIFVGLSYLRVVSGLIRSKTTLSSVAMEPAVLPAKAPLPRLEDGITVVSFNVLLPNGNDGWWMYKVHVHLETIPSLIRLLFPHMCRCSRPGDLRSDSTDPHQTLCVLLLTQPLFVDTSGEVPPLISVCHV